jgi:hypothetical protein
MCSTYMACFWIGEPQTCRGKSEAAFWWVGVIYYTCRPVARCTD